MDVVTGCARFRACSEGRGARSHRWALAGGLSLSFLLFIASPARPLAAQTISPATSASAPLAPGAFSTKPVSPPHPIQPAHPAPLREPAPAAIPAVRPVIHTQDGLWQAPDSPEADGAASSPAQPQDPPPADAGTLRVQLQQAQENLAHSATMARRGLIIGALCLLILILVAIAVIIWLHARAREWNRRSAKALEQAEAVLSQLTPLRESQEEIRTELPAMLQEIGEQPLNFQEEGTRFPARALTALDDVDHLAYLGSARLVFSSLSRPEEAVYLNGLLLSSVAQLARSDLWAAMARLDRFLERLNRHRDAAEPHRIAQAYSYRALAAYRVLEAQDGELSWLRKSVRQQSEMLAKQAFSDVAQASRLDPEWKHAAFVEALLCSRFYSPDETGESSRAELHVRGLRRAIDLYKQLIEEKSFRGPARHNLARCHKRIAEQTGEKSDFSDFGYALSSFPTDEELSDEALAARQPDSRDRFLWQWMLADPELFRSVERISLAEYRSFWIRLLDNKVHLRNWRADLGELHRRDLAMREWGVQLLHVEPAISFANPIGRRAERFEPPSTGA